MVYGLVHVFLFRGWGSALPSASSRERERDRGFYFDLGAILSKINWLRGRNGEAKFNQNPLDLIRRLSVGTSYRYVPTVLPTVRARRD